MVSKNAGDGASPTTPDPGSELDRLQAENEALRQRLGRRIVWRKWVAVLLVVLTSLTVVAATIAFWAHQTVFDTDQFMETVEPALEEPAFYSALSDKVSAQLIEALDIETRVTASLTELDDYLTQVTQELLDNLEIGDAGRAILSRLERPSLVGLAGPVTDWVESRVELRTEGFITSEEFRSRFPGLVRRVHEATVALVRNEMAELPNVYIEAGEVRLNLIPIIAEALRAVAAEIREYLPDIDLPAVISDRVAEGREQLGAAIQERLPEDFGQVTIMSEASLAEIQAGASRLDRFVWVLVGLAILLAGVTVIVSPTRRRTGLQLAIGVVLSFVVSAIVLRRVQSSILAEITTPDGDQAARVLLGEVFGSLRTIALIVGAAALVAGVGAYLSGRPAWLRRASEGFGRMTAPGPGGSAYDRWVAGHADLLRVAGIVIGVVVLFFTGFEPIAVIIIGALVALFLWAISTAIARVASPGPESVEAGTGQSEGANTT
jgi:hypothetical protein